MKLKERGISVGDLLIILIIIIASTILIKSFSKDKKSTLNYSNQEQVSYKGNYYQKFMDFSLNLPLAFAALPLTMS